MTATQRIGTPHTPSATKVMLLGAGELGREVTIELMRLGCEVVACDRYDNAPAMQMAQRKRVFAMRDAAALRAAIAEERPHLIVPEIEAIATEVLAEAEAAGIDVVPTARAAQLTMDREGIRRLAAETLGLPTSPYRFACDRDACARACVELGFPCVIKPTVSSSGKGQSVVRSSADIDAAWHYAQTGGRVGGGMVIIEGFVRFDYEITLLTVAASDGIHCLEPVGHIQIRGDYRESWQPCAMSPVARERAEHIAKTVVGDLCRRDGRPGRGLFGVECFVRGDEVIFSEVSPRPHDTGLVTLGSQVLSEFALHARAILGLPIGQVAVHAPAASVAILGRGEGVPTFHGLAEAHQQPSTRIYLFGKPVCTGIRRLGVAVATGSDTAQARHRARQAAASVRIHLDGNPDNVALPYPEEPSAG